jgi:glucose-6-phosphate 1-dehydrogenase
MAFIKSQPTLFVLFGATGDLTWRKIIPAFYNLLLTDSLPEKFSIIGIGRTQFNDPDFRNKLLEEINQISDNTKVEQASWDKFASMITYLCADINNEETYIEIGNRIRTQEETWGSKSNVIYYLAMTPQFFPIIAEHIHKNKLAEDPEKTRIVIEKPFGHDLESAKSLNALLAGIFQEKQIYRIDHYLGKETVQNIMAFRFANSILEPIWNRNYIEHVQISVTEELGVENRGAFYEGAGALRDMVQNHILQLLCLVAMETPINFNADEVRNRKVDVLRSIRGFKSEEIRTLAVRGQYSSGWMEGKEVPGYREEANVDKESNTETFVAIKFFVDNWRWKGVPFYVRTGKRLHQSESLISIQFRDVPHQVFPIEATDNWQQNRLLISIQPEMSIRLQMQVKRPGLDMVLNTVDMEFNYENTYTKEAPKAYETLLVEIMMGDQTLFMRADQVEAAWELLMPILNSWESKKSINFPNYAADSWGPENAEALIARDGFHWFTHPVKNKNKS